MGRKPLTPEQKQARIDALARGRATRAANLASKKAAVQNEDVIFSSEDVQTSEQEDVTELQVNVNLPDQPVKKLSLKERLFGNSATPSNNKKPTNKTRSTKKTDNNLISTVLPTIIAGFISTYAYDKLPEPYKVCAPSKQEVNAMLGPIMAIIARRVEVTGKASQDAIDIANALICGFAYGTRAYITYINIKREENNNAGIVSTNASNNEQRYQSGDHQAENNRVSGIGASGNGRPIASDIVNVPDGANDANADGTSEIAIFNAMFARDKRGRAQLGLLPSAI